MELWILAIQTIKGKLKTFRVSKVIVKQTKMTVTPSICDSNRSFLNILIVKIGAPRGFGVLGFWSVCSATTINHVEQGEKAMRGGARRRDEVGDRGQSNAM